MESQPFLASNAVIFGVDFKVLIVNVIDNIYYSLAIEDG